VWRFEDDTKKLGQRAPKCRQRQSKSRCNDSMHGMPIGKKSDATWIDFRSEMWKGGPSQHALT